MLFKDLQKRKKMEAPKDEGVAPILRQEPKKKYRVWHRSSLSISAFKAIQFTVQGIIVLAGVAVIVWWGASLFRVFVGG